MKKNDEDNKGRERKTLIVIPVLSQVCHKSI